jgi:cytidylate kinase
METKEHFVITINRELGSGGRTIGRKLAELLGVKYYDKAIIQGLTDKYGLSAEEIERLKSQEKSSWWENFQDSYRHILQLRKEPKPSTAEMFETERHILEQLASRESCVVAGRSGFIIFRDWKKHLNIFIQAPLEQRIERVMKKQGLTYQAAIDTIDQVDEGRETYIRKYCDRTRYDTRNYDLVINMTGLSEDDAVAIIMEYFNRLSKSGK